ncbi:type VI secretion system protein TssA [Bordetella bronchialis]|uniref:type VI secretion system protein TssA n=1 Tax=Bordetella bronchialis TaxID=463025 RepID=UPI003D003607
MTMTMEFAEIPSTLEGAAPGRAAPGPWLPCGEDLEYDADFLRLQQSAAERSEQQFGTTIIPAQAPDWREVEKQALALLERTRDIRVMSHLTRAWTETRGLPGYADGLALCAEALEDYWEALHPRLDSVGEDDPLPRVNALASLGDVQGCARSVRSASLIDGVHGRLSLREAESILDGSRPQADAYPGGRARLVEHLRQAWVAGDPRLSSLAAAERTLRRIQETVAARLGSEWMPDYTAVLRALDIVLQDLHAPGDGGRAAHEADAAAMDGHGADAALPAGAPAAPPQPAAPSVRRQDAQIHTRDEAMAMLTKVCAYFEVHEPGHPAPYVIRRAQQLIPMSFHDIMRNLAPQGLEQFELLLPRDADGRPAP